MLCRNDNFSKGSSAPTCLRMIPLLIRITLRDEDPCCRAANLEILRIQPVLVLAVNSQWPNQSAPRSVSQGCPKVVRPDLAHNHTKNHEFAEQPSGQVYWRTTCQSNRKSFNFIKPVPYCCLEDMSRQSAFWHLLKHRMTN